MHTEEEKCFNRAPASEAHENALQQALTGLLKGQSGIDQHTLKVLTHVMVQAQLDGQAVAYHAAICVVTRRAIQFIRKELRHIHDKARDRAYLASQA